MGWGGGCTLYRMYDKEGALLYVGISGNVLLRIMQHQVSKPWFDDVATVDIQKFPSKAIALAKETEAIQTEAPRYNINKAA